MPLYEYKCSECDCKWDLFKPVSRMNEEEQCPDCGAYGVKLFPSTHTLVVKGQGFCGVSIANSGRHKKVLKPGEVNPDGTLY